jgi:hypothetical protein
VLVVVGGIAVLWLIFRPRPQPAVYGSYPAVGGPAGGPVIGGGGPMMGGPVMGGGGPVVMGPGYGTGGGMLGALGTGLAVGAGVAAGEELVHRVLDGGGRETVVVPREAPGEYVDPNINSDMGGNDFGLSDGNSWGDDNSGGSFGGSDFGGDGGDDWT